MACFTVELRRADEGEPMSIRTLYGSWQRGVKDFPNVAQFEEFVKSHYTENGHLLQVEIWKYTDARIMLLSEIVEKMSGYTEFMKSGESRHEEWPGAFWCFTYADDPEESVDMANTFINRPEVNKVVWMRREVTGWNSLCATVTSWATSKGMEVGREVGMYQGFCFRREIRDGKLILLVNDDLFSIF